MVAIAVTGGVPAYRGRAAGCPGPTYRECDGPSLRGRGIGNGKGNRPVVIGDGNGYILHRNTAVIRAAGLEVMGDDGLSPVAGIVEVVIRRRYRHCLSGAPDPGPGRGEGQAGRGCREGCPVGYGKIDHDIAGRFAVEPDGVGSAVLLRFGGCRVIGFPQGEAGRDDRDPPGVVVVDGD